MSTAPRSRFLPSSICSTMPIKLVSPPSWLVLCEQCTSRSTVLEYNMSSAFNAGVIKKNHSIMQVSFWSPEGMLGYLLTDKILHCTGIVLFDWRIYSNPESMIQCWYRTTLPALAGEEAIIRITSTPSLLSFSGGKRYGTWLVYLLIRSRAAALLPPAKLYHTLRYAYCYTQDHTIASHLLLE